jgi:hypothetical protein
MQPPAAPGPGMMPLALSECPSHLSLAAYIRTKQVVKHVFSKVSYTQSIYQVTVVHTENKEVQADYKYILEIRLCSELNTKQGKSPRFGHFDIS